LRYSFHCLVRFRDMVTYSGSSDGRLNFVILDDANNFKFMERRSERSVGNFNGCPNIAVTPFRSNTTQSRDLRITAQKIDTSSS
jgi:hypothetical protein